MSRQVSTRCKQVPPAIGAEFDKWRVIGPSDRPYYVKCRCACGKEKDVAYRTLYAGHSTSCLSCARSHPMSEESKLKLSRARMVHGHHTRKAVSPTYRTWCMMHARCYNENFVEYPRYGARGIRVCERWHDFQAFLADMGERPSLRHSVDRFPNKDGDYEPGNCRWATSSEQNRNRRNNRLIIIDGRTQPLAAWLEETGIRRSTFYHRTRLSGMSDEQALSVR